MLADSVDEARLAVETVKDRLISLRQTPARKAAGETIARLERQLAEVQTNH